MDDIERVHLYNMYLIDSYDDLLKSVLNHLELYLSDFDISDIIINADILDPPTTPVSIHNHSNSSFTAVVYLNIQQLGGEIVLYDPRINANRGYPDIFDSMFKPIMHQPVNGEILIMPGYLYHSVQQTNDPHRIAIPIDIFMNERG